MRFSESLIAPVFVSKIEALELLVDVLGAKKTRDQTLRLKSGGILSIDIPMYGEDLPLTLDLYHRNARKLGKIVVNVALELEQRLGWKVHRIPKAEDG